MLHGAEKSKMASEVATRADNILISLILTNNCVNKYVIGPNEHTCDTFKLDKCFKLKMATKTDNFRISPISAKILVKNKCVTPRYMLLDTINTFIILLNWSVDVSQNGGQKFENLPKMHDINCQKSATNQNECVNEAIINVPVIITNSY